MDVFFTLSDGEGFAAVGRDQVDLAGAFVFGSGIGVVGFFGRGFALGEEGDPAAVGRQLRFGVVTGLRELDQRPGVVAVEPEIGTEDLLIPVGALGGEDDGTSVGGEFDGGDSRRS